MFVGPPSAEVLVVPRINVRRTSCCAWPAGMIELNEELSDGSVYADRLLVPENDSVLLPLPADRVRFTATIRVCWWSTNCTWSPRRCGRLSRHVGETPGVHHVGDLHSGRIS